MKSKEYNIPKTKTKNDFTIIYKGRKGGIEELEEEIVEIKTSRNELFSKLRYFENKSNELRLVNEYFIHDEFDTAIFKDFISSLETQTISLNDNNYLEYGKLCSKYQYYELQDCVNDFIQNRPDIQHVIDQISSDKNQEIFDFEKEKILSKNLDFCLEHGDLSKVPISVLTRIFNSPEKVLHNRHLLFNFIKQKVQDVQSKNGSNEDVEILFSSLDYNEMSADEIEEFLAFDGFSEIFGPSNSKAFMKSIIQKNKSLEERIEKVESELSSQKKSQELLTRQFNEMSNKMEEQFKLFEEQLHRKIDSSNLFINSEPKELRSGDSITLTTAIRPADVAWKVKQDMDEAVEIKSENGNSLVLRGKSPGKEATIAAVSLDGGEILATKTIKVRVDITGKVELKLQSNNLLKGTIKIDENEGFILDKSRSRYIVNKDDSIVLGEVAYSQSPVVEKLTQEMAFRKPKGTYYLHALIVDNYGNSKELVSNALTLSDTFALTFDYTGSVQNTDLEPGEYKLEIWGAQGGTAFYGSDYVRTGGKGGYSVGIVKIASKTKLFIYVGEQGVAKESEGKVEGGFNGGGYSADPDRPLYKKGVGGGGTDIRIGTDSLYSRVIVAGGGGGGNAASPHAACGGAGGGVNGCAGTEHEYAVANASPGTQICGGKPGTNKPEGTSLTQAGVEIATGKYGIGGSVTAETVNSRAGAGGGGWYGGGAGNYHGGAGSGGSGWVFTEASYNNWKSGNPADASKYLLDSTYYLSDARTVSGNQSFPSPSGSGTETGHCGNGYVKITVQ